jgi:hypothetical protein
MFIILDSEQIVIIFLNFILLGLYTSRFTSSSHSRDDQLSSMSSGRQLKSNHVT